MPKNSKSGMTLVEILVATFVFTIALGALLSSVVAILYVIDTSKDQTVAVNDVRNMMEQIRATAFDDMLTLFPNGTVDGPGSNLYADIVGSYTLNEEHIAVRYTNATADPLEIKVSVSWQDKRGRAYSSSMSTFKAR